MKIFNRGESKQAKAEDSPAKTESAPASEAAPPAPPAPPQPDLTAIIDANVKEMSEKIARLATSIESEHSERADFEAKLEKMEDRMRKLSALTEMISAQYNPFVGSAPSEREPMPQPEVGLSAPLHALPVPPPAAAAAAPTPVQALELTLEAPPAPPAALPFDSLPPPLPQAEAPAAEPAPAPYAEDAHAAADLETLPAAPEDAPAPARLWSIPADFASSMLALKWADMLLRSAPNREALVQLVDYYQNIGWVGQPARDQLLAYADGLTAGPEAPERGDWRAHADLHEKTLLYVEKLRALSGRRGG